MIKTIKVFWPNKNTSSHPRITIRIYLLLISKFLYKFSSRRHGQCTLTIILWRAPFRHSAQHLITILLTSFQRQLFMHPFKISIHQLLKNNLQRVPHCNQIDNKIMCSRIKLEHAAQYTTVLYYQRFYNRLFCPCPLQDMFWCPYWASKLHYASNIHIW